MQTQDGRIPDDQVQVRCPGLDGLTEPGTERFGNKRGLRMARVPFSIPLTYRHGYMPFSEESNTRSILLIWHVPHTGTCWKCPVCLASPLPRFGGEGRRVGQPHRERVSDALAA